MIHKMFLFLSLLLVSVWAINLNNTIWNTNWNVMSFWQVQNQVSAEYMYDGGIITGTMFGDTLRGWWREHGNAKECGPENTWSGPLVFKFSADGKSFTGDWGYCDSDPTKLNPESSAWTGTIKDGVASYTQKECEDANRFWCNGECKLVPCDSAVSKDACEKSGRFWCTDTCKMTSCTETSVVNPTFKGTISNKTKSAITNQKIGALFDLQGKKIHSAVNGISIYIDESCISRAKVTILP